MSPLMAGPNTGSEKAGRGDGSGANSGRVARGAGRGAGAMGREGGTGAMLGRAERVGPGPERTGATAGGERTAAGTCRAGPPY